MWLADHEAVIISEGRELPEFQTETTWSHLHSTSTCWVPSNEGKPFIVELRGGGEEALQLRLMADGLELDTRIADRHYIAVLSGNRISQTQKGTFVFARGCVPIEEFDEDERDMVDPAKWIRRGTITLEVYHVSVNYLPPAPTAEEAYFEYFKSNGDGLHTVSVGPAVTSVKPPLTNSLDCYFVEPWGESPFLTFHFKHRPQEWLEKYSIMPPPLLPNFASMSLNRPPTPPYIDGLSRLTLEDQQGGSANRS